MFSLRLKLFLAMLLASILLTISLLGSMQWSFTRGFGAYLREQQQLRLASIAEELAAAFATMVRERVEALLVLASPLTFRERGRLAELRGGIGGRDRACGAVARSAPRARSER